MTTNTSEPSLFARLRARLQRSTPPAPTWLDPTSNARRDNDADPAADTTSGYPHHYTAIGHTLTTGEPNRADELLYIETEVARHADANTLDEGSAAILDPTIASRLAQWHEAITVTERRRAHVIRGILAAERHHLDVATFELEKIKGELACVTREDLHWRAILTGQPVTPLPTLRDVE